MNDPSVLVEGVVVALGERRLVGGFALAGAQVRPVETARETREAWDALGTDVALVILTRAAAEAIGDEVDAVASPLTAVLPS